MSDEQASNKVVGYVPYKRISSSVIKSHIWGKTQEGADLRNMCKRSDLATPKQCKTDGLVEHVSRRRRVSMQSSCSADNECASVSNENVHHESIFKSPNQIADIRSELEHTELQLDLPDPKERISPDEFLMKLVRIICNLELEAKKARSLAGFFCSVSDEQMAAYTIKVVSAVRANDLDALKALQSEGQTLNCFNRFGESLLTMACRRGFEDIVEYLLKQPDIDIRISDDNGRTILHDACWNPSPQLKICKWILEREPALFFVLDNRGCSAFHYARPEHWGIWRQFLLENRESLKALEKKEILAKLSKSF
jgi:Ankyrin repeats (3 copies)